MLFVPPARFVASGPIVPMPDGLDLRSLISLERRRNLYVPAHLLVIPADAPVPNTAVEHCRVNDCSAVEQGVHVYMVRPLLPLPSGQEDFEDAEQQMMEARLTRHDSLRELAQATAQHVLAICDPTIRLVFGGTVTTMIIALYWLEFSGQLKAINKFRTVEVLRHIIPRLPFDLEHWRARANAGRAIQ